MSPMDWQALDREEFDFFLGKIVVPELEKIICIPLSELGQIPSYWSGSHCNHQKCESCWMKKNLWEAKWYIHSLNSDFQIVKAHFYTGYLPYVRSARTNTPDTWMSGVFCVTMFRARISTLAPLRGCPLKAKGAPTFVTPFACFTVLRTTPKGELFPVFIRSWSSESHGPFRAYPGKQGRPHF